MERGPSAMWICLLGSGLSLVLTPCVFTADKNISPTPPLLIGCVFQHSANVSCHWEPGDLSVTDYTLHVMMVRPSGGIPLMTFHCKTSSNNCEVVTKQSARFNYCISVTAHSYGNNVSSPWRCQSGRVEVMLPPVPLHSVMPIAGSPRCLNVTWKRILSKFPVSANEVKAGKLQSQIEFTCEGQSHVQVKNVTVTNTSFLCCFFRPYTSYTIRLRHRYVGSRSPWSQWSNAVQGRTGEDAPFAAPSFWRRVKQTERDGQRLVSLLWKPPPPSLANGIVCSYIVTCGIDSGQVLIDLGSCRDLGGTSASCSLLLPAGRCSCTLRASTSAGTSPEARVWLLGASEAAPPAPTKITVTPLGDSSMDVRWTAPTDESHSGFVVEWFAVWERNMSVLHWEKLSSDSRALVITEGVEPSERYAVSVKALYAERGTGKSKTVNTYTRQGAPSAGPKVEVQLISSSRVELSWDPLPVELLHGFLRNYTLYYRAENKPARRVFVSGRARRHSLENLLPGNYDIFIQANTDAGAGPAGTITNVHIDSEEISIVICILLPIALTVVMLLLLVCLTQNNRVKQKLWKDVPDPSHSSLAHWTPKATMESMRRPTMAEAKEINYSGIVLLGDTDPQNCDPDEDLTYHHICHLQTFSSHPYSSLPASGHHTLHNLRQLEGNYTKFSRKAKTASSSNLSCCSSSSMYANLLPQTCKDIPTPFPTVLQCSDFHQGVNVSGMQRGGDSEPSVHHQCANSNPPLQHFPAQYPTPFSFSEFSKRLSHSSAFLSRPAGVTPPLHPFPQSIHNSVPVLPPSSITHHDAFTAPLPPTLFVDLSYCPIQCDPYISAAV